MTQAMVLEAAMTENNICVLIYANDRAMAEPLKPLPDPLEVCQYNCCHIRESLD